MSNQALAYKYGDVISEMDKHQNALNQTLLTNVEEVLTLENFWREVMQNATGEEKSVAENEIAKLRKILISRTNITLDLLQSDITSESKKSIILPETPVKNVKEAKEVKVISIASGKVIEDTTKTPEVFDIVTKEKVEVQTVEPAVVETKAEDIVEPKEAIVLITLRDQCLTLVKEGKKDEALELAKAYLFTGNYLAKPGKKPHIWNEKELNGWFKDLCEKANDSKSKITVEAKSEEEVKNTETTDAPNAEEEEKARIHKAYYGNKSTVFEFSKMKLNEEDEEKEMVELAKTLLKLKDENKTNEIEVLLNLFFMDPVVYPQGRGYNNLQKHNWWNAVQKNKAPLENNIEFVKNSGLMKKVDNPQDLFTEGKRLIEEEKVDEKGLISWFKEQVSDNKIAQIKADFSSESEVVKWVKNMFGHFFRKTESSIKPEEVESQRTAEIIRVLQETDPVEKSITDVVKEIKNWHVNNNIPHNLSTSHKEIVSLAQTHNLPLYEKYTSVVKDLKDTKIKIESKKEVINTSSSIKHWINNWKENIKYRTFFETPLLRNIVKEMSNEEAFEFIKRCVDEGRAGTYFSKTSTIGDANKKKTVTLNFSDDELKQWIDAVKGVVESPIVETEVPGQTVVDEPVATPEVTETETIEETTPEVVEPTVEESTEVVPTEEVTTPIETLPAPTEEVVIEETTPSTTTEESSDAEEVEVEEVANELSNDIDISDVINSTNRKEFEQSVGKLFMEHSDKKEVRRMIMSSLKGNSRNALGKYPKNISKNKEGDIHKMLNKIEDNISIIEV